MFDRSQLFLQFYAICRQAGDDHQVALKAAEEATTAATELKTATNPA